MKASYETVKKIVTDNLRDNSRLVVAIDGCCASGKTTLAQRLTTDLQGDLIHMDDFFLPLSLRTSERYDEPGGNIHYERFLSQIVQPILAARSPHIKEPPASIQETGWPVLQWNRFACHIGAFAPDLCHTLGKPLLIIEGCYCMRPEFWPLYDLSFFIKTSYEEQLRRIQARNGKKCLQMFKDKWIPLENRYFSHYHIAERCLFQIDT